MMPLSLPLAALAGALSLASPLGAPVTRTASSAPACTAATWNACARQSTADALRLEGQLGTEREDHRRDVQELRASLGRCTADRGTVDKASKAQATSEVDGSPVLPWVFVGVLAAIAAGEGAVLLFR